MDTQLQPQDAAADEIDDLDPEVEGHSMAISANFSIDIGVTLPTTPRPDCRPGPRPRNGSNDGTSRPQKPRIR